MINTSKHSSLTEFRTSTEERGDKGKNMSNTVNVGDKFTLECGHEGRVVFISPDGKAFAVKGVRRKCRTCGKGASGAWAPTVYIHVDSADATPP